MSETLKVVKETKPNEIYPERPYEDYYLAMGGDVNKPKIEIYGMDEDTKEGLLDIPNAMVTVWVTICIDKDFDEKDLKEFHEGMQIFLKLKAAFPECKAETDGEHEMNEWYLFDVPVAKLLTLEIDL